MWPICTPLRAHFSGTDLPAVLVKHVTRVRCIWYMWYLVSKVKPAYRCVVCTR